MFFRVSASPENFLHPGGASSFQSTLLTKSFPPKCFFPQPFSSCLGSSRSHFGPSHVPCIFMGLLLLPHLIQRYLIAAAHHSVRCFFASPLRLTKTPLFFAHGQKMRGPFSSIGVASMMPGTPQINSANKACAIDFDSPPMPFAVRNLRKDDRI